MLKLPILQQTLSVSPILHQQLWLTGAQMTLYCALLKNIIKMILNLNLAPKYLN